jgi:hypothetical protein
MTTSSSLSAKQAENTIDKYLAQYWYQIHALLQEHLYGLSQTLSSWPYLVYQ